MKCTQGILLSTTIFGLSACDSDVVVSKGTNAAPTVLISSHADGETFANGDVVTFRAVATVGALTLCFPDSPSLALAA